MAKISPVKKSCFDTHSDISDARFKVIYDAASQVAAEGKRGIASNEDYITALNGLIGASNAQITKLSAPTVAPTVVGSTTEAPAPTTKDAAKAQIDNDARAAALLKDAKQQWETTYEIDEDGTKWTDLTLDERTEYALAVHADDGTSGDVADRLQMAHLITPKFSQAAPEKGALPTASTSEILNYYATDRSTNQPDAYIAANANKAGQETIFWGDNSKLGRFTGIFNRAKSYTAAFWRSNPGGDIRRDGVVSDSHEAGFATLVLDVSSADLADLAPTAYLLRLTAEHMGGNVWAVGVNGPQVGSPGFNYAIGRGGVTKLSGIYTRLEGIPEADTKAILSEMRRRITRAQGGVVPNVTFQRDTGAKKGHGATIPADRIRAKFSETGGNAGSQADVVLADLKKMMHLGALGNKISVVQSVGDLPAAVQRSVNPKANTQGFVVNGKAYLVADNIAPGKARAVFLHEVGAHLGLENLLGKANYAALVGQIKKWAARADNSQESKLAQAAQQRVADAGTDATQTDSELLAYFIEEAVDAGVDPTATKGNTEFGRWFRQLWAAFKRAMHQLGINPDKLTAQNVVDMAYGAAKLEATGTFHGAAAQFRKFDHKYMNSGEGAQAFGWGSYFAQAPGIAKGYFTADVNRKARTDSPLARPKDLTEQEAGFYSRIAEQFKKDTLIKWRDYFTYTAPKELNDEEMRVLFKLHKKVMAANPDINGPEGAMYRVDFNVADDEWLDLDKPLSEQSEKVKAAVLAAGGPVGVNYHGGGMLPDVRKVPFTGATPKLDGSLNGHEFYDRLEKALGSDKAASEYLDSIGIKGNKFLDANSRGNGIMSAASFEVRKARDGSFDVQFYDAQGNETWAVLGLATNPEAFAVGREKLAKATKPKTSNFVVFNDKNIQRVSSMKAADRDRVSFSVARPIQSGNKVIDAMPGAVASAWDSLKHHGGLLATKMMLTEDLIALASKVLPSASKYLAAMNKVEVEKTKSEQQVADILGQFNKLTPHEKGTGPSSINALIKASTTSQKWAFKPDWLKDTERTELDPVLQARFNAMSKPAQDVIKSVFKHGDESRKAMQKAVLDNTNSEFDAIIGQLKAEGNTAEVAKQEKLKAKSLKDFQTTMNLSGAWPYAPLRRFGKHVVVGMSARYVAAFRINDTATMQKLEKNGDDYYVAFAETRGQAVAMRNKIAPLFEGGAVNNFEKLDQADSLMGGRDMIGALRRLRKLASEQVEDKGIGEATNKRVDDLMRQLYLTLLAETSARKGEINRRNISGADDDMMRAFATNGRSTAHFIAALKTGGAVDDNLAAMRSEVRHTLSGREKPQQYFNEIMRRHSMNLEFTDTPGVDKALAVSSTYLLLSNPSYFLMNATQPWMMSHPMMAGKHGYHNTASVLLKSYQGMASILKDGKFDGKDYGYLPEDVRDAVRALAEQGIITIELGQELGKFASSPDNKAADLLATALTKLRNTAQGVETLNRLTTAITAYRLEMQKPGASKDAAIKYAAQVITETHGNYTGFNAPRFMRTGVGRIATQFRKFQLIQLSMFARLLNRSFAGASPQEKAIARKALAFNLAHLAAVGGTAAMPGFVMVSWLLGKALGDEDEPDDLRAKMTRELGKPMADLLWGGLSQKAGVPLGGRIGAGGMLSLLPYTDIEVSRDGYADIALGLAGPTIGGLMPRAADGIGMMLKGDLWKGTEALLPAGVANAMKAGRFAVDGVTQRNGDVALNRDEIGFLDVALQAVGLPTNTIQDRTWLAGAKFDADKFYNERTTQLKRSYADAVESNDPEAMRDAREAWQSTQVARRELGYKVQPLQELLKAPAEKRNREASMRGGVATNKGNAGFVAALQ